MSPGTLLPLDCNQAVGESTVATSRHRCACENGTLLCELLLFNSVPRLSLSSDIAGHLANRPISVRIENQTRPHMKPDAERCNIKVKAADALASGQKTLAARIDASDSITFTT
jgi:hypothetical protein